MPTTPKELSQAEMRAELNQVEIQARKGGKLPFASGYVQKGVPAVPATGQEAQARLFGKIVSASEKAFPTE